MSKKIILALGAGLVLLVFILPSSRREAEPLTLASPEAISASVAEPDVLAPPFADPQTATKPQAPVARTEAGPATNLLARLLNDDSEFRLTLQQVEPFLQENRRSAESLLAAARATGDLSFLREAIERYPNDPRVNFAAIYKSASPEERRQRIEAFKQGAPDNVMAYYISAQEYFKSGQTEQALQEIAAGSAAGRYDDYSGQFMQNTEEAYRAAGYSEAEAKAIAVAGLPLPYLAELKRLGQGMGELANSYRQNGDEASAQALVQQGVNLAQQVGQNGGQSSYFINQLVGIAIERKILEGLEPSSPYDTAGRTVQDRLSELIQRRETLKEFGKQAEGLLATFSPAEVVSFFERVKVTGEMEAARWALNRKNER